MFLDEHKLIAFFGKVFAEQVQAALKLEPTTGISLVPDGADNYYVEVRTPNPVPDELTNVILDMLESAVLSEDAKALMGALGKLTIHQTTDTPPVLLLTGSHPK